MTGYGTSLISGFAHPFHGADHLVAMLAVGVWGTLAGGRAIRVWPIAFVATMLVGLAGAAAGIAVPLVEPAILSSIVVLGLFVSSLNPTDPPIAGATATPSPSAEPSVAASIEPSPSDTRLNGWSSTA